MACNQDITDKLDNNKVGSESLAVNTKRIRELTNDLKNATDCDHIKMQLNITGDELDGLVKDIKEEAKKLLGKYLPIVKIPTNPMKIIPWAKKLVTGTITPQVENYIKLLRQAIELATAINDFVDAVDEIQPKLKQCAIDTLDDVLDPVNALIKEAKGAIDKQVAKIASEIASEVNGLICETGIADLVGSVNDAIQLTDNLVDTIKETASTVDAIVGPSLTAIGVAGNAISEVTGIPFEVDTSSAAAFTTSVDAGKANEFTNNVNAFISAPPPVNTSIPTLTGSAVVGETLTVNNGIWTGNSIVYTYSWFKNNEPIYGANLGTYVPTSNDVGYAILCTVSADNAAGGDTANTLFTANVTSNAPVCSVLPTITGTANVGEILSVSTGTWTGSPTFTYQWQWAHLRANIHNANTNSYTVDQEDYGRTLTCAVTGSSSGGQTTVHALATGLIGVSSGGAGGVVNFSIDTFTGNSSNVVFTLSYESTTNNAIVSINGAVQDPTSDYTVVAQALTFSEAPFTDDEIVVRYIAI